MKRFILLSLVVIAIQQVTAQTVGISDATFTPNTQAVLDLTSDRRGFLPPRLELNGDDLPISGTKPAGLMVFNSGGAIGPDGLYYWTGSAWTQITTDASSIGGSGTLNYVPKFTPDGITVGNSTIYDDGNVGIGTTSNSAKLTVKAGSSTTTLTDYTQALSDKHGLLLTGSFGSGNYQPGVFWNTDNENANKPKAGIFLNTTAAGSTMLFGTSTTYATGLTNTAMAINDLGNIGIGSTSPGTSLDVVGDARIGNSNGGLHVLSQGSSRVNLRPSIGNGNILISDDSGQAARGLTVVNGGTVGIGTDATSTKLHVYHATNSGVAVGRAGTPSSLAIWRYNGADTEFGTLASDGVSIITSGTERIFVHSTNGYVGIGNNNSTEQLDVSGKIRMRSGAAAGYIPVSDANGAMTWTDPTTVSDGDWTVSGSNQYSTVSGNVGIGTSTPGSKLVVTGDITLGAVGVDNGIGSYTIAPYSGASVINGGNGRELILTGGPSDNNAARRGGHLYLRPGTPTSPATTYGTIIMADQGGNVGVGSSTANAKLHITSAGNEDGYIRLQNSGNGRYSTVAHDGTGMLFKVSSNGDLFHWEDASGNILAAINPNTTNMGIGTSAPAAKLEVASTDIRISSVTDAKLQLYGSNGNRGHMGWVAGSGYEIWNTDNTPIQFATTNAERMRIQASGVVGIGVTDPIGKAHVNGSLVVQTQHGTYGTPGAVYDDVDVWGNLYSNNQDAGISILAQNSSDYALWQSRFAMKSNSGGSPRIAIDFNSRNASNVITSSVEAISIPSSGHVGMGTVAPSQKLHVQGGNVYISGDAGSIYGTGSNNTRGYIQAVEGSEYGGAGASAAGLIVATSGGEAICFKDGGLSGNQNMVITGLGRVGIGSMSPAYKLELPNNSSVSEGWVRAYNYATYSDKRLKTNVAELNYGLDAVMKLRPVSYYHHNSEFKDGSLQLSKEGSNTFGLLAQEAYEIIPEMVNKPADEEGDLWSVDYSKLGSVLVKALQEQQAQIEMLEREVEKLKDQQK